MDDEDFSPNGGQHTLNEHGSTDSAHLLKQELKESVNGINKQNESGGTSSRFSFLRSHSSSKAEAGSKKHMQEPSISLPKDPMNAKNTRRLHSRRGSLRKAAILSLGRTRSDREQKSQPLDLHELKANPESTHKAVSVDNLPLPPSPDSDDYPTPRASIEDNGRAQALSFEQQESTTSEESLPLLNFTRHSRQKNISTTDEDEFSRSSPMLQVPNLMAAAAAPVKESYFSPDNTLLRRRASRARSPLSALPVEPMPIPEEWSYSETEWWGWFILILTWSVFVMGMGSCFEVWSWAWAVGKTPYAPPELEDDPTLPIVGYYPALIILTGVMAWIWVFTAWVGMKYFRHAKIS